MDMPRRQGLIPSRGTLLLHATFDRIGGILQQVCQSTVELARIALNGDWYVRQVDGIFNAWMRALLQEDQFLGQGDRAFDIEYRRRHAREGGEFVDHAPDITNLADDSVGTDSKCIWVVRNLFQVFSFQPF